MSPGSFVAGTCFLLLSGACGRSPSVSADRATVAPDSTVPESVSVVWRAGAAPYVLRIEEAADAARDSAPRLRIQAPGRPDVVVAVPGGLVPIDINFHDSTAARDNLLKSSSLYLTPRLRGPSGAPMLIVFGWGFGSDPGSLVILTLDPSGAPVTVFQSDAFELNALVDLDGDGVAEVVGKHSLSEVWGRCFETYDPYSVYRLAGSHVPRAVYDSALSRSYNIAHYFGWAGPKARGDIAVVRCAPGGPRLMDTAEAVRQFGSK